MKYLKPVVFWSVSLLGIGWLSRLGAQEQGSELRTQDQETAELPEVVVVATRTKQEWLDASGSVVSMNAEDFLKSSTQDLGGIGKYDPTISVPFDFTSGDGAYAYGQSGYGSINIRGVEGNRVAIELDGVRQPPQYVSTSFDMGSDGGSGGIGRDYYDPAMFEMVEVLKGGASALYGSDALGGVVSFTTPEPEDLLRGKDLGGLLRAQYFSVNDSIAAQAGGAYKHADASVMLLTSSRTGHETENHDGEDLNPLDFTSNSVLLKTDYQKDEHHLTFTLEGFERESKIDARSAADSSFTLFDDYVHNEQELQRLRASVQWTYAPKLAWFEEWDSHLYWQQARSQSNSDSASKALVIGGVPIPSTVITRQQEIDFDTDIIGTSSVVQARIGEPSSLEHHLMSGIEASVESSENRFHRVNTGVPDNRISFAPTTTERVGWFVQDEVTWMEKWTLTPGLRTEFQAMQPDANDAYLERLKSLGSGDASLPEDYQNLSISPRLSLSWKPVSFLQSYATYAHGVRNPSAEELSMLFDHPPSGSTSVGTLTVPNPDLKEETSDAFELGVKGKGDAGRFQIAGFYTRYQNFIENGVLTGETDDEGRDIVTTVNRGRADIYGFEASGRLEMGHLYQPAEGWFTSLNTGKSVGINRSDDTWLNSVDPWKTAAAFGYDSSDGKYGIALTGTYMAAVNHVDDSTSQGKFFRPSAWFTLDLGLKWQPREDFSVHLGLNNLFDEKYWLWSSVRRGDGHLGGNSLTDRTSAPGRNFSVSITKTF